MQRPLKWIICPGRYSERSVKRTVRAEASGWVTREYPTLSSWT